MKKNIILISLLSLNIIIVGFVIYQNNYINSMFQEINKKIEYLYNSDNQQKLQINQLTNHQLEQTQQNGLKDLEKGTDESIFENPSIEGLKAITQDEAQKIWEDYLTNTLLVNISNYTCIEIKIEMVKPSNRFTAGAESNVRTANFERSAYLFKYKEINNLEEIIGYVDMYTSKVISGYYNGD